MKKCKWAGDVNDEYCKDCNGCEVMFEGRKVASSECAGYEEGTEEIADTIMNPPVEEQVENVPFDEEKTEPVKEEKPKKSTKATTKKEKEVVKETTPLITTTNSTPNSTPKTIRIMSGASKEIEGVWYKFEYEQTNELNPNLTPEQVEEEKEKLWAIANAEVDKQLADVVNSQ